jgi:hypothetical protein
MKQLIPILHLTPTGIKILGGYAIGDRRYFTPFEISDMMPFYMMGKDLPLWKDLPPGATVNDLHTEIGNQELFRQEIVYRIIAAELKEAVLYSDHFKCPFAKGGCSVASKSCQSITRLDTIPTNGCSVRFYAEQKQLNLSRITWSQ